MNFGEMLTALMEGPAGMAMSGVVILAIVELVTGIAKAFASKQFDVTLVDAWVRKTVAGRVIPILILLIAGEAVPDMSVLGLDINILSTTGLAAAATFAVAALGSITDNIRGSTDTPPTG